VRGETDLLAGVLDLHDHDALNERDDVFDGKCSTAPEVDVLRRARRRTTPELEHQGPLEDELVREPGARQTV
jgi:hypothetical protein